MKIIERIKLWNRANKYKNKYDIGGISFLYTSIKKGQTVLDIGAHKAGYIYWMRKLVGESGKVVAFEPQSYLFKYISALIQNFKWNNVIVEHLAISDIDEKSVLHIPLNKTNKLSSPAATLLNISKPNKIQKTEIVNTQTVDNYCQTNNIKPDFLKVDVEGNELNVFKGAEKTILKCKPRILVEIEWRHAGKEKVLETFVFLESMGYTGHFIHKTQQKALSEFSFETYQNESDMNNYCNNFTFEMR